MLTKRLMFTPAPCVKVLYRPYSSIDDKMAEIKILHSKKDTPNSQRSTIKTTTKFPRSPAP